MTQTSKSAPSGVEQKFKIWPRLMRSKMSMTMARNDNPEIFAHFARDPSFFGMEMTFFHAGGKTLIATNLNGLLHQNERFKYPEARTINALTPEEILLKARMSEADLDCFRMAACKVIRPAPKQVNSEAGRWIKVVLTRNLLMATDKGISAAGRNDDWTRFARQDQDLTPAQHTAAAAREDDQEHFGSTAMTGVIDDLPESAHARLAYLKEIQTDMRSYLKRRFIMTPNRFQIHPDWDGSLALAGMQ
jgi:hypothetical protein